jgi:4-amino-4-deoxy-L-arabinose transferase-like glycosyltransferase
MRPDSSTLTTIRSLLVLLALLLPALLAGLGMRPILKIQEARVAETAREMLASGDWAVPRYNGELRLQKPPLSYWLSAASFGIGGVNETSARLPSALFGLLTALILFLWQRREAQMAAAANTVLALVVSFVGLRYFRSGEADAPLIFFITAACLLGYDILRYGNQGWRRPLFGLALGLAFLSKGPAGLAVPLAALLGLTFLERRRFDPFAPLRRLFSPAGLALLALTAFGWYAWILWRMPDSGWLFFSRQVDETFVSGTHAKPAWWYLAHYFEFFAPWGILLLPAAWWSYRMRGADFPPALRFAWVWLACVFLLLTATVNKQTQYALLLAPPTAIVIGHYLAHARNGFARLNRAAFRLFCLLGAALLAYLAFQLRHDPWLVLGGTGLIVVPLALRRLLRADGVSAPVLLVSAASATIYLGGEVRSPDLPQRAAMVSLMTAAADHAPLYQFTPGDGAVSFYAGRVVPPIDDGGIDDLVRTHPDLWLITERMPAPGNDTFVQVVSEADKLKLLRLTRKN